MDIASAVAGPIGREIRESNTRARVKETEHEATYLAVKEAWDQAHIRVIAWDEEIALLQTEVTAIEDAVNFLYQGIASANFHDRAGARIAIDAYTTELTNARERMNVRNEESQPDRVRERESAVTLKWAAGKLTDKQRESLGIVLWTAP